MNIVDHIKMMMGDCATLKLMMEQLMRRCVLSCSVGSGLMAIAAYNRIAWIAVIGLIGFGVGVEFLSQWHQVRSMLRRKEQMEHVQ